MCLKKGQEHSSLGWPVRFPLSLLLPVSLLPPPFARVSILPCSLVWPAFSTPGTLRCLWFFSSASFCLQLLTLSFSSNSCLSFTHSSYKKPVLKTFLSPPFWIIVCWTLRAPCACLSYRPLHVVREWGIYLYIPPIVLLNWKELGLHPLMTSLCLMPKIW